MSRFRKNNEFSFWEHKGWLEGNDIVVVGAGFVGLSAAIECAEKFPDARVLVVDGAAINGGGSTKNAGFACFGSLTELVEDIEVLGVEGCVDLVRRRFKGLRWLRSKYGDEALGFEATGSHEILVSVFGILTEKLNKVNEALRDVFDGADAFEIVREVPGIQGCEAAIRSPYEGLIDTSKAYRAVLERARGLGVEVMNGVTVEAIVGRTVVLEGGAKVKAGHVLVANNAMAAELVEGLDVAPQPNRVMVTEVVEGLEFRGTLHYDRGYVYLRRIDTAEGPRMLVGGGRQWGDGESKKVREKLLEFLRTHIVGCENVEVEYEWIGYLGVGSDREPICRTISDGVHAGVKLGGMGVALGGQLGKKLAGLVKL